MKNIILLNGPPRSGKDTVADIMRKTLSHCQDYKMSMPLKKAFRELMAIDLVLAKHLLEEKKDEPLYRDFDATPRDVQIALSENVMKPLFGDEAFGRIAVNAITSIPGKYIVISDCGFGPEIVPLQKQYGYDKVYGIRISRPDCDYSNDSRSDVDFDAYNVPWESIHNQYEMEMLEAQVRKVLRKWEFLDDDV